MSDKKAVAVGIDLGTTYSAIAYINEDTGKAEIITSPDQERITASVVLFEDSNNIIVGETAKQNAVAEPEKVVEYIKRQMGKPKDVWSFKNAGKQYSAQEISAIILKKLKNDAETRLGLEVKDAVITCPAYFGDPERAATKEAGIIAGLNVLAVIDEPIAAALSYGLDKAGKDQKIFIFDLGGGTFDVVILEIKGGKIRELAVNGDHMLGGKDWDDEMIKYVASEFKSKYSDDPLDDTSTYHDLQIRAVAAKKELSKRDKVKITCSHAGHMMNIEVTRDKYEEITSYLVEKCRALCELVLSEANLSWKDIDNVLLVGGSTRMPMIKKMLGEISGKAPSEELNPDECVALGAAWEAAILLKNSGGQVSDSVARKLANVSVQKVSSHNLSETAQNGAGGLRAFLMIPKLTPLPAEKTETFATVTDNQTTVKLEVMEGGIMGTDGTCDPADCTKIGEALLENIPSHPKGAPIEVTYRYNSDGSLEVHGKDVKSGKSVKTIIHHTGGLSEQELGKATAALQKVSISN